MLVYPLKAVITTHRELSSVYNRDATSILLTSECVTPDALKALIAQGAQFEKIVATNGEGEEVIGELVMSAGRTGVDGLPQFERIFFGAEDSVESIMKQIHGACAGDEAKGLSSHFEVSG